MVVVRTDEPFPEMLPEMLLEMLPETETLLAIVQLMIDRLSGVVMTVIALDISL